MSGFQMRVLPVLHPSYSFRSLFGRFFVTFSSLFRRLVACVSGLSEMGGIFTGL